MNLGYWEDFDLDFETDRKMAKKLYTELKEKISNLSNSVTKVSLTFKTDDTEEAKKIVREARRIVDEYKGSLLDSEIDLEFITEMFVITKQPQCPKCGKLGKFSDFHCPDCGTELEPKEYVDV